MLEGQCHCGGVRWTCDAVPESATACNCSICRRYGVLWIYGHENEDIRVHGETRAYMRENGMLEFLFCPSCGCVASWRALRANREGRQRIAVNIRLCELEPVTHLVINHVDGMRNFEALPHDGRRVADMWF